MEEQENKVIKDIALELTGISKTFGKVKANQDICIKVEKGTVHGIIGENGAGKSTLMNILYGFYYADSGNIYINGSKADIKDSQEAIKYGIGMVHQHFMLVDTFTVLENIILGAEEGFAIGDTLRKAEKKLKDINDKYGLYVDPHAIVSDLSVGLRQRVEILKALYRDAKILILDEPTGVLTPQEADKLFEILKALREEGVTTIIITHKLREIMAITNNVSVMHHGKMIAHRETSKTNMAELAELMVGRKVHLELDKKDIALGEVIAKMEGVSVFDKLGVERLKSVSLEIRRGEVVGIAGVSGNGQTELIESLAGMQKIDSGKITVMGRVVDKKHPLTPKEARKLSIGHIPEDRLKHGIVKNFSAKENSILGFHNDKKWNSKTDMKFNKIRDWCVELMEKWDVRPRNPEIRSADFSGGNQQKLIVGREIEEKPDLILIGQPTRGVDIGAIEFIHNSIIEQRDKGCGILLVSVELEEVMSVADRILVMFDGKIVGEVKSSEADEKILGLMMANAHERDDSRGEK